MQLDTQPEDVGLSTPRLARVTQWMRRWVDSGQLPGLLVAVVRNDRLAYFETCGYRDVEAKASGRAGHHLPHLLDDQADHDRRGADASTRKAVSSSTIPVAQFIPAFADTRVFAGGDAELFETEPLARPVTVHDLMTHTSGLTYGFQHEHPVDALYRARRVEFNANFGPLAGLVDAAAAQPLLFQPGCALELRRLHRRARPARRDLVRLPLDTFFEDRIFAPLGMCDTGFPRA